jgi:hypothetical protein
LICLTIGTRCKFDIGSFGTRTGAGLNYAVSACQQSNSQQCRDVAGMTCPAVLHHRTTPIAVKIKIQKWVKSC